MAPLFAQYCCSPQVVSDPACFRGLPSQVQAAVGQSELGGAEVGGPVLRMDAGNMQCLTAQVIAHPCHNTLVLQQSHETAEPVLLSTEPCGQQSCIDTGVQQVRAEAGNIRMLPQFSIIQDADV